ncbi:hypothetical protein V1264_024650 [Littorina saxatilis]|uniref:Uncharacterized protein n=1 Tax=Littorina saxatilis TaxID=31220 RepID=A0AAN9ALZ7_9CAEN
MIASQVFGVIGAVMMTECMVVEGAMMTSKGFRKYGIWIFIAMDAVGLFCMVTEFAMYVNTTAMEKAELGYSSGVTILAFLLSIVAGICCVVAYFDEMKCTSARYLVERVMELQLLAS